MNNIDEVLAAGIRNGLLSMRVQVIGKGGVVCGPHARAATWPNVNVPAAVCDGPAHGLSPTTRSLAALSVGWNVQS